MTTRQMITAPRPVGKRGRRVQDSVDGGQSGWFCYGFAVLALCGLAGASAWGGEDGILKPVAVAAQSAEAASDSVSDTEISTWIRQLDANRFSKRQDAGRLLKEKGIEAVAALREAAESGSREASSRALRILNEHFSGGDGKLKTAAKAAIEKLTESERASVARKATGILHPEPKAPRRPKNALGQAQIQVRVRRGNAPRRVQIQNINGVKNIEVQEKDRTVKIENHPENGIKVEITEKKNGKNVKQKVEAKNAAELKKKNPEAHKLYKEHGEGWGVRIHANVQAMQVPARIQKAFGRAQAAGTRRAKPRPLAESLEEMADQMEKTKKLLEQFKSNPRNEDVLSRAIEQLEKTRKLLAETREHTE